MHAPTFFRVLAADPMLVAASLFILLLALVLYVGWYRKAFLELDGILGLALKELKQSPKDWHLARDQLKDAFSGAPVLRAAFSETKQRVVELPDRDETKYAMFSSPRDIWSPQNLLKTKINLPLADAVPNLLVGIGLFFTFLFLTIALTNATAALMAPGTEGNSIVGATQGLLSAAGAKFLTSMAGLSASIVWTYQAKKTFNNQAKKCEEVLSALAELLPANAGEQLFVAQLEQAQVTGRSAETREGIALDLLQEAREQTGALKRFETDLTVSLASAITQAFTPQMEGMTTRLTEAIEALSGKLGAMNQEALQSMLSEFSGTLRNATKSEMTEMRGAIGDLTSQLHTSAQSISLGATDAADVLSAVGERLRQGIESAANRVEEGSEKLAAATEAAADMVSRLDSAVEGVAEAGKEGVERVSTATREVEKALTSLEAITSAWPTIAASLGEAADSVTAAIDDISTLSRDQQAIVEAFRTETPRVLAGVERVATVLDESAIQARMAMESTKDSMESTYVALRATVASITEGVTQYTNQVADLHMSMDKELAKAVGSFGSGIQDLGELVEDLAELVAERQGVA